MFPLNVAAATTLPENLYRVTAGVFTNSVGYSRSPAFGVLTPDELMNGLEVDNLISDSVSGFWYVDLTGINIPNNDATFVSVNVQFESGVVNLVRASATYSGDVGGSTRWLWNTAEVWLNTQAYFVDFNL